jgi:hypothetical protein
MGKEYFNGYEYENTFTQILPIDSPNGGVIGDWTANESSRVELGLTQARLMKIRVESS